MASLHRRHATRGLLRKLNQDHPATPKKKTVVESHKFQLNKTKTLRKKLKTTYTPNIRLVHTHGGTRVFFSTAAYELMKDAFWNLAHNRMEVTSKRDEKGLEFISTTRLKRCENKLPYTVNWYHTKCSLLVNGQGLKTFHEDLLEIGKSLLSGPDSCGSSIQAELASANHEIRQILMKMQDDLSEELDNSQNISHQGEENCINCKKPCEENQQAALCEYSNHWVHYNCDKLSRSDIRQIEQEEAAYICSTCVPTSKKRAISTIKDTKMLWDSVTHQGKLEQSVIFVAPILQEYLLHSEDERKRELINPATHETQVDTVTQEKIVQAPLVSDTMKANACPNPQSTAERMSLKDSAYKGHSVNQILKEIASVNHRLQMKSPGTQSAPGVKPKQKNTVHSSTADNTINQENNILAEGQTIAARILEEVQQPVDDWPACFKCGKICDSNSVECSICEALHHASCILSYTSGADIIAKCWQCQDGDNHTAPKQATNKDKEHSPVTHRTDSSKKRDNRMPEKKKNDIRMPKEAGESKDANSVMKELRQREAKCKRWEQDLKARENDLIEKSAEILYLQGVVVKLENRIVELEKSNKLLRLNVPSNQDALTDDLKEVPQRAHNDTNNSSRLHQVESKMQQLETLVQMTRLEDKMEKKYAALEQKIEKLTPSFQPPMQMVPIYEVPLYHQPHQGPPRGDSALHAPPFTRQEHSHKIPQKNGSSTMHAQHNDRDKPGTLQEINYRSQKGHTNQDLKQGREQPPGESVRNDQRKNRRPQSNWREQYWEPSPNWRREQHWHTRHNQEPNPYWRREQHWDTRHNQEPNPYWRREQHRDTRHNQEPSPYWRHEQHWDTRHNQESSPNRRHHKTGQTFTNSSTTPKQKPDDATPPQRKRMSPRNLEPYADGPDPKKKKNDSMIPKEIASPVRPSTSKEQSVRECSNAPEKKQDHSYQGSNAQKKNQDLSYHGSIPQKKKQDQSYQSGNAQKKKQEQSYHSAGPQKKMQDQSYQGKSNAHTFRNEYSSQRNGHQNSDQHFLVSGQAKPARWKHHQEWQNQDPQRHIR